MADVRYEYPKYNAVKIIVYSRQNRSVLMLQEPDTFEWMPNRWGLPGGKALKNELLRETLERKIDSDIGSKVNISGIFKIEELVQDEKTIIMYIFVAETEGEFQPNGESKNSKWVTTKEIATMDIDQFTEFYNSKLLQDFLKNPDKIIPLEVIESWNYNLMIDNPEYKKWINTGRN